MYDIYGMSQEVMPPPPGKEEKEEKAPKADDKPVDGAIAPAVED